ncbi:MAG: hypothetical protein ACREIA_15315 [Opitutaceae bacterium]
MAATLSLLAAPLRVFLAGFAALAAAPFVSHAQQTVVANYSGNSLMIVA